MDYQLQKELCGFVREEGKSALTDTERVSVYLKNKLSATQLCRLQLVLSCNVTRDFIENVEKIAGRTEVNNLIMTVVRSTGLKVWVVKETVASLLDAAGIVYDHKTVTEIDPVVENAQLPVRTTHPKEEEELLEQAAQLVKEGEQQRATEIYEKLAKGGCTEAMYQLAMVYLADREALFGKNGGLDAAKSEQTKRALNLLRAAAEDGHTLARTELGNYHFDYDKGPEGLKKAFAYYSSPGIPTTDTGVRERLCAIYNQEKTNYICMILGAVLVVSIWVFTFVCCLSKAGSVLFGWGIGVSVLVSLIYGFAVFSFFKFRYVYLKLDIGLMILIWLIYPLILVLN